MGRKPSKNMNLPPRMRARRQRSGKLYYYYDTGGVPRKEIPLGNDFIQAVRKWSELEAETEPRASIVTFRHAAERYIRDTLPLKSANTQKVEMFAMVKLMEFFDDPPAPLKEIKPVNIRQYLDWRIRNARERLIKLGRKPKGNEGQVRANREKQLFSHIWNKAREWGYVDLANPCVGIKGYKEKGRQDIYIRDDLYQRVYEHAKQPLRDAMDLAYLTGQRPSDVLEMNEYAIDEGCLVVQQGKTGTKVRIAIVGELQALLERIRTRKSKYNPRNFALIVDERGQQFTLGRLQDAFAVAREKAGIRPEAFQFRDLRAKAASDKAEDTDLMSAQYQLGHASVTMTEHYIRNRRGKKVAPTK
ncbi:Phage integrase family protein [Candidatus Glomeribacter gigasporarum BEG34]|uniref:Phage integrase family protein n=1 Tax=Candidatus Glomeribacter gigasporarum BEG34 TaxID=1070319 RepID=G2JBE8_9BURK|nr:tyrosine-type recombinase/integrase [Candidatus Glomeribacter gigasporarum]CCD30102.1 Phage integrase family protein [Candidatus Glomeribacter gigasporarum BEG34]